MKHFRIIAVLALSVSLLTGCDFFRSILGKPTSSDIERIRLEQAERQKAVKDSLAAVTYANILCVKEGNETNQGALDLLDSLHTDAVRDYITNSYNGAVVAMF